jgi:hypothetical protein
MWLAMLGANSVMMLSMVAVATKLPHAFFLVERA